MDIKEVVLKALFGAVQAAAAEFIAIQVVDQNTLYVALIGAGLRGGIAFLSELKSYFDSTKVSVKRKKEKSLLARSW